MRPDLIHARVITKDDLENNGLCCYAIRQDTLCLLPASYACTNGSKCSETHLAQGYCKEHMVKHGVVKHRIYNTSVDNVLKSFAMVISYKNS